MDDQYQRSQSRSILATAAHTVTSERGNQHGGAEDSFQLIGKLWTDYLVSVTKHRTQAGDFALVDALSIGSADVAHLMVLLKVARAVHGDPTNQDNYVDGAGYMSLAGALSMGEKRVVVPAIPVENTDRKQAASLGAVERPHPGLMPNPPAPDLRGTNTLKSAMAAVDASEQN